jgi:hypothetical protein
MTPTRNNRWPVERVLFALAGTVTLASALLAATVSPWFLLLTAFVGVNQWLYVTVGACPASLVLRRVLGVESCRAVRAADRPLGSASATSNDRRILSHGAHSAHLIDDVVGIDQGRRRLATAKTTSTLNRSRTIPFTSANPTLRTVGAHAPPAPCDQRPRRGVDRPPPTTSEPAG